MSVRPRLRASAAFALLVCAGCGGSSENANEAEAAGASNAVAADEAAPDSGEPPLAWVYVASGERGGAEAVYGIVQGESFLAITCDRSRRALKVTALGLPERVAGPNEAIRAGGVRGEFPVRWTEAEYGGETMWDRASEIPVAHPLAAALAEHRGPIVFELTEDGVPAEIPTDDAVRRVAGECRSS